MLRTAGAMVAMVALVALVAESADARGGNHGCTPGDRTIRSDHFWPSGDVVLAGYFTEEGGFPPATVETFAVENFGRDEVPNSNSLTCGGGLASYTLFSSALGPGDDRVRVDGVGLQNDYDAPPGPLPKNVATLLAGGTGDDVLWGHAGFDDMSGGAGNDVLRPEGGRDRARAGPGADLIRAAGGRKDNVACGPGRDKAIVDRRDDVRGCERIVLRRG
jgi:Ca2+-binding RTX toxin-like protein